MLAQVFNEVLSKLKLNVEDVLLAQGTLRPDLIESASHLASSKADVIKTHHNDSQMIRALREQGHVIEPLKDFHKDEVGGSYVKGYLKLSRANLKLKLST